MFQLVSLPFAISAAAIWGGIFALLYICTKKIALSGIFSAYIFLVLWVTLLGRTPTDHIIELHPLASYRRALNAPPHLARIEIRNALLNIAMFIPLGIFLPIIWHGLQKFYLALPVAFFAAMAIEAVQLTTRRGVFALEDILHNTAGAALGIIAVKIIKWLRRSQVR